MGGRGNEEMEGLIEVIEEVMEEEIIQELV